MKLPLWVKAMDGKWIRFPYELLKTGEDGRKYVTALDLIRDDRWKEVMNLVDWERFFTYSTGTDMFTLKEPPE